MSSNALSGNDTLTLDGRLMSDFADGDVIGLEFPNDSAALKTGKNGNTIYVENQTGKQAVLTIRMIPGSGDDKYLNNRRAQQFNDFSRFILMAGEFTKKIGDGQGNQTKISYQLSGGVFQKPTAAKNNVEGDTEASVGVYVMIFSAAPRLIT